MTVQKDFGSPRMDPPRQIQRFLFIFPALWRLPWCPVWRSCTLLSPSRFSGNVFCPSRCWSECVLCWSLSVCHDIPHRLLPKSELKFCCCLFMSSQKLDFDSSWMPWAGPEGLNKLKSMKAPQSLMANPHTTLWILHLPPSAASLPCPHPGFWNAECHKSIHKAPMRRWKQLLS